MRWRQICTQGSIGSINDLELFLVVPQDKVLKCCNAIWRHDFSRNLIAMQCHPLVRTDKNVDWNMTDRPETKLMDWRANFEFTQTQSLELIWFSEFIFSWYEISSWVIDCVLIENKESTSYVHKSWRKVSDNYFSRSSETFTIPKYYPNRGKVKNILILRSTTKSTSNQTKIGVHEYLSSKFVLLSSQICKSVVICVVICRRLRVEIIEK